MPSWWTAGTLYAEGKQKEEGRDYEQQHRRPSEGVNMPASEDSFKDRLARYREITISVTGRNSGRTISVPVWFVLDGGQLYLLPVQGSNTQWYKNIRKNPSIQISARGAEADFNVVPLTDPKKVSSVVEKFRERYGAGDVKKYYSKLDVAVLAEAR
jgi:deazaflavin-dependent oxidoreductase (nitroreductase family)